MNKVDKKKILERVKNKGSKGVGSENIQNTPKKADMKPYKKDIYDTFVMWFSIPIALKNMSEPERIKLNLSELAMTLTSIRTKDQFSKIYGVDRHTISNWDKNTKWDEINTGSKRWQSMLTSNIRLALYKKILKDGVGSDVMVWEKIVNDFSEKTTIKHSGGIYNLPDEKVEDIKNSFRKNAHRRTKR